MGADRECVSEIEKARAPPTATRAARDGSILNQPIDRLAVRHTDRQTTRGIDRDRERRIDSQIVAQIRLMASVRE